MGAGNKQISTGNSNDKPAKTASGRTPASSQTNFERLVTHLAKDSLAERLVIAYAAPDEATPADAVAKVARRHLDELKRSYGKLEDQQD